MNGSAAITASAILEHPEDPVIVRQNVSPEDFLEESSLGLFLVYNSWQLVEATPESREACHLRNFCELGLNSAFCGQGSQFVADFFGHVMSRWIATDDNEEKQLLASLKRGMQMEDCAWLFKDCENNYWKDLVLRNRNKTQNLI